MAGEGAHIADTSRKVTYLVKVSNEAFLGRPFEYECLPGEVVVRVADNEACTGGDGFDVGYGMDESSKVAFAKGHEPVS